MEDPTLAVDNSEPIRSDSKVAKNIHGSDVWEGRDSDVLSRRISLTDIVIS